MTTDIENHESPAIAAAIEAITGTKLGSGFYLKRRDARTLALALDNTNILKKRLR